jgi:hypothetical protein
MIEVRMTGHELNNIVANALFCTMNDQEKKSELYQRVVSDCCNYIDANPFIQVLGKGSTASEILFDKPATLRFYPAEKKTLLKIMKKFNSQTHADWLNEGLTRIIKLVEAAN